jgi:hypothetical protein
MLGGAAAIVMGALSLGKNLADSIKASKEAKAADDAAKQYAQDYKNIEEINYMAGLQAPDISKMQQEEAARATQMSIQAMQEMGPNAAQVGNIVEAQRKSNLETAQKQGVLEKQVEQQALATQQQIESNRVAREEDIAAYGLEGAQAAALDAQNRKTKSVEGMFGAAALGIQGIDQLIGLYGKNSQNWDWTAEDNSIFNDPNLQP